MVREGRTRRHLVPGYVERSVSDLESGDIVRARQSRLPQERKQIRQAIEAVGASCYTCPNTSPDLNPSETPSKSSSRSETSRTSAPLKALATHRPIDRRHLIRNNRAHYFKSAWI